MSKDLQSKVFRGTFWVLFEKVGVQAVHFVVTLVLSRLLTPSDYGTVALLAIFVAIAGVLVDGGFGRALVQKKDATDCDYNSVFYLSVVLSLVVYGVLFVSAPAIAEFYKSPELCAVLRVISLTLLFDAISGVQSAELTRKMLFHLSFRISLISTLCAAVMGIGLAWCGYGPWALVGSTVTASFSGMVARWFVISWRPRCQFSWTALKPLFSFGWKMSVSSLLDTGFNNLYGLVIGRMYSKADLAFVDRGRMIPGLVMGNVNDTLSRVAFPALVQMQDEKARMCATMRRMMSVSTFLIFPLMTILAICARRVVLLLFGEAWLPAVPYLRLLCFSYAMWPFHTVNLQCIQALGRSDVFLTLEIIKKSLGLIILVAFIPFGVFPYMVACAFAASPLSVIINTWPNRKLLNYSIMMQILDVAPSFVLCSLIVFPVWGVGAIFSETSIPRLALCLCCQGIVGLALYFAIGSVFKLRPLAELVTSVAPQWPVLSRYADYLRKS